MSSVKPASATDKAHDADNTGNGGASRQRDFVSGIAAKDAPALLYDFSRAVFGNYCRTARKIVVHSANYVSIQWLEAHQDRSGQWSLYRRYQDGKEVSGSEPSSHNADFPVLDVEPIFEQIPVEEGLSLFQVLTEMAAFEKSVEHDDGALGMISLDQASISELGVLHYRSFGIRECVAFDAQTGMPAHSYEGRIIARGVFSEDMEAQILKAWDMKKAQFATDGNMLDTLVFNIKPDHMINHIFDHLDRYKALSDIIQYFEDTIFPAFEMCRNKGFDFEVTAIGGGAKERKMSAGQFLADIIEKAPNDVIEPFTEMLSEEDLQRVFMALQSLDILRCVLHARWALNVATDMPEHSEQAQSFIREQVKLIQLKNEKVGLNAPSQDVIEAAIIGHDDDPTYSTENSLQKIRAQLKQMRDDASKNVTSLRKTGAQAMTRIAGGPKR
jgi:hypothetical protein